MDVMLYRSSPYRRDITCSRRSYGRSRSRVIFPEVEGGSTTSRPSIFSKKIDDDTL